MYLKLGSYWCVQNAANVKSITRNALVEEGVVTAIEETWDIDVILMGDTDSLITQIAALEAAVVPGINVILYKDNQTTVVDQLLNANCRTGATVLKGGPGYPNGGGVEFATMRTVSFQFSGSYWSAGLLSLYYFHEQVQFTGDGSGLFVVVDTLDGPVRQDITDASQYKASQSGRLLSRASTPPDPPSPIWPEAFEGFAKQNGITPIYESGVRTAWEVNWGYSFASVTALSGRPRTSYA